MTTPTQVAWAEICPPEFTLDITRVSPSLEKREFDPASGWANVPIFDAPHGAVPILLGCRYKTDPSLRWIIMRDAPAEPERFEKYEFQYLYYDQTLVNEVMAANAPLP